MNYYIWYMLPNDSVDPGKKKRIMIAATGGGVLLIVIIVFMSIIFSGPNIGDNFTAIAQRQEEIARIADIGADKARNSQVNSTATTIRAAIASSQNSVISRLAQSGINPDSSLLQARQNASTDQELNSAEQANKFDEVFVGILSVELQEYQSLLESTYSLSTTRSDRELLDTLHSEASVLLKAIEK